MWYDSIGNAIKSGALIEYSKNKYPSELKKEYDTRMSRFNALFRAQTEELEEAKIAQDAQFGYLLNYAREASFDSKIIIRDPRGFTLLFRNTSEAADYANAVKENDTFELTGANLKGFKNLFKTNPNEFIDENLDERIERYVKLKTKDGRDMKIYDLNLTDIPREEPANALAAWAGWW